MEVALVDKVPMGDRGPPLVGLEGKAVLPSEIQTKLQATWTTLIFTAPMPLNANATSPKCAKNCSASSRALTLITTGMLIDKS